MDVVSVPLADLHADPANARLHDQKNIGVIKGSLTEFKQYQPLVVQKSTMKVVVGNGRFEAMKQLRDDGKWGDAADCVVLEMDDVRAAMLSVADNRSAELADWDDRQLARILQGLDADQQGITGFTVEDMAALNEQGETEPEPTVQFSEFIGERQDYIVLTFSNETDWLSAQTHFGLNQAYARRRNGKPWSKGIGRVVDGAAYLKRITEEKLHA